MPSYQFLYHFPQLDEALHQVSVVTYAGNLGTALHKSWRLLKDKKLKMRPIPVPTRITIVKLDDGHYLEYD